MKVIEKVKKTSAYGFIRKYRWVVIGLVFTCSLIAGGTFLYQASETHRLDQQTIAALTDTVTVIRNINGSQTASITAFKAAKVKDVLRIKSKDSAVRWLQSTIAKYSNQLSKGGSVAVFSTGTTIRTGAKTVIIGSDTATGARIPGIAGRTGRDSIVYVFPKYHSDFHLGKWVNGSVTASKDSTFINLVTCNEYEAVIGEHGNIFKGYTTFVDITTKSPYDSIKTVRAFLKSSPTPKRWGLGVIGGYGLNLNASPTIGGFIGVGVSYNFIRW